MTTLTLRDYQHEAVDSIEKAFLERNNALVVLATGMGKTETLFGYLKNNPLAKVIFIVNKVALVTQTAKRMKPLFPNVGIVCGSLSEVNLDAQITIASIQTLVKYLGDLPKYNLAIFDEAHRVTVASESTYQKFLASQLGIKYIGLTATPFRNTGYIYGNAKLFKQVDYSRDIGWGIQNGWLVKPKLKHVQAQFDTSKLHTKMGDFDQGEVKKLTTDLPKVKEQITHAMSQLVDRKKIIWHCSCIAHAEMVKENIPEEAVILHSKMSDTQREEALYKFENGNVRHLVFIMIVSEGYDYPPIDAVVLMRPTRSPLVYIQTVGRALRIAPNKKDCLVLDFGQVIKNCGPLNSPHIKDKTSTTPSIKIEMKFCPECYEYMDISMSNCPSCDYDFVEAALQKQRNYLKKLDRRPDQSGQLLKPTGADAYKWVLVDPVRSKASYYRSRKGTECIRLEFYVKGLLLKSYIKYITVDREHPWTFKKAADAVSRVMMKPIIETTALDYVNKINEVGLSHIKEIQVYEAGKYPDIIKYKGVVQDELI